MVSTIEHYSKNVAVPEWTRRRAEDARRRRGAGDRFGCLNSIDEAARSRAVAAIQYGKSVSLSRPLTTGASTREDDRVAYRMDVSVEEGGQVAIASDHVEIDCHGALNTHIDALNHIGINGKFYGDWPVERVTEGPSIFDWATGGIVTRAVFVDIPAVRGTPWVEWDQPADGDDIEAALSLSGQRFHPGDALLLYMGRDRFEEANGVYPLVADSLPHGRPGAGRGAGEWIADHGVSVLCWDMMDAVHPKETAFVVHLLLWAIGLPLVDNCEFRQARMALNESRKSEGMLVLAPLPMKGATGSILSPIVVI
jgi:kynurenine formamidase